MKRIVVLCLLGLVGCLPAGCSDRSDEPFCPPEVRAPLDGFMGACAAGDFEKAFDCIEPRYLEDLAKETGAGPAEARRTMVEKLRSSPDRPDASAWSVLAAERSSDSRWVLEVLQKMPKGDAVEKIALVLVGGKWYMAAENFTD
ncbi:MAG: hypothetical protein RDV41_01780 [Planctomycetota bacterium]|nr:hypothetical protein [Planctomycetota bacterium]